MFLIGSLFSPYCFSQILSGNYFVHLKGNVQIIYTYKGGAAPTEEMLKEINKCIPMANAKLFLKKTYYGNVSYVIETDTAGNFDLDIKPGVYNIYLTNENSASKKIIDSTDVKSFCEEQYKTQSHGKLKVYRKGNSPLEITINDVINPCGPLPAVVPPKQN